MTQPIDPLEGARRHANLIAENLRRIEKALPLIPMAATPASITPPQPASEIPLSETPLSEIPLVERTGTSEEQQPRQPKWWTTRAHSTKQ